MRYPCLSLAVATAAGILAASTADPPLFFAAAVFLSLLAGAWAAFLAGRDRPAFVLALAAAAAFGGSLHAVEDARYSDNVLRSLQIEGYADFSGILVKSPSRGLGRDVLLVHVRTIRYRGREFPAEGRLRVSIPVTELGGGRIRLHNRDRVRVSAQLSQGGDSHNFHAPFHSRHLKSRGIHNRAFSKSARLVEKTADGPRLSPGRTLSRIRLAVQDAIETRFSASPPAEITATGAVLEALLLGEKGRLDPDTLRRLQASGLYHLFAISGAHIAILSFLVYTFLRLIRLRRRHSYFVLMAVLVFFALFVEGRPSVFRATLMALVHLTALVIWRDAPPLNNAGFSAFLLLTTDPFSLFDVGFQLTFAATLSIILFAPRLARRLPRLPLKTGEMTAVSIAAVAGVMPLIAVYFNRVTLSSIPLNIAAVPLVGAIMLLGFLFIPLSLIAPFAAAAPAAALDILIHVFLLLSGSMEGLTPLSYRVPTPGLAVAAGYGTFLILLLAPIRKRIPRAAVRAVFVVFLFLLAVHPFPARSRDLKMTMIDVGQGEAVLVEFPGKRRMLVDGGGHPHGDFDPGENVVSPFLWRKGFRRIDILVLSHPHPDHLNGMVSVAKNFKIGEFWESFPPEGVEAYARLDEALVRTHRRRVFRGDTAWVGGTRIDVLHPVDGEPASGRSENDRSIVLRISFGETAFLLTGDIERSAEEDLVESAMDLSAAVLKSPHHGSRTSSSAAFIDRVRPAVAVISVGRNNSFGLPNTDVLETYARAGVQVYRTDVHGAVEIASDGRSIRIRTSRAGIPPL